MVAVCLMTSLPVSLTVRASAVGTDAPFDSVCASHLGRPETDCLVEYRMLVWVPRHLRLGARIWMSDDASVPQKAFSVRWLALSTCFLAPKFWDTRHTVFEIKETIDAIEVVS